MVDPKHWRPGRLEPNKAKPVLSSLEGQSPAELHTVLNYTYTHILHAFPELLHTNT